MSPTPRDGASPESRRSDQARATTGIEYITALPIEYRIDAGEFSTTRTHSTHSQPNGIEATAKPRHASQNRRSLTPTRAPYAALGFKPMNAAGHPQRSPAANRPHIQRSVFSEISIPPTG